MRRWANLLLVVTFALVTFAFAVSASQAEDLVVKDCQELIRMATNYEEDLKTVDIMLGAAIDFGDLEKVKTFKLKKAAVKKQLGAVIKAIEIKECVRPR